MTTTYKLRTHLAVLTTAVTLLVVAATATEQTAIAQLINNNNSPPGMLSTDADLNGTCYALPASEVLIPKQGGSFLVEISGKTPTIARFPEWVRLKDTVTRVDGLEIAYSNNTVMVTPITEVASGVRASIHLVADKLETTMNLKVSKPGEKSTNLVMVTPLAREEYERRRAERELQPNERNKARRLAFRRNLARLLLELKQLLATHPPVAALDGGLSIDSPTYAKVGEIAAVQTWSVSVRGDRYFKVTLDNQTTTDAAFEKILVSEGPPYGVEAEFVLEQSAKTVDGMAVVVPAKSQVTGMVLVPDDVTAPLGALQVHFKRHGSTATVVALQIQELYPMPAEERRRRRLASQVSFSMRVIGGAMWFGAGVVGAERLAMTNMAGFAARFQKGYINGFALEAEFAGARTGGAEFADLTWQGTQGDATRSATLARLSAGGAMRFGTDVVFTGRAGLSFQGASYRSDFLTNTGSTMPGPGDGFEVDLGFYLGLGVDVRIGKQWLLGISMDGGANTASTLRFANLGLRFVYGWNTKRVY